MEKRIPPHRPGWPVDRELSADDEKIAELIALGKTRVEIGDEVHMAPDTVKDRTKRVTAHHELHAGRDLRPHQVLVAWLARRAAFVVAAAGVFDGTGGITPTWG